MGMCMRWYVCVCVSGEFIFLCVNGGMSKRYTDWKRERVYVYRYAYINVCACVDKGMCVSVFVCIEPP